LKLNLNWRLESRQNPQVGKPALQREGFTTSHVRSSEATGQRKTGELFGLRPNATTPQIDVGGDGDAEAVYFAMFWLEEDGQEVALTPA